MKVSVECVITGTSLTAILAGILVDGGFDQNCDFPIQIRLDRVVKTALLDKFSPWGMTL
jgi:hypothetical protein